MSLRQIACTAALAALTAPAAMAQEDTSDADALFAALGLSEMIEIMHLEGLSYGEDLATDLLDGQAGPDWPATVGTIYDPVRMEAEVRAAFAESLAGDDVQAMIDFFTTDLGAEIVELEVSARRALLDEDVEAASEEAAAIAMADETPRYEQVTEYIEANDLIEQNVVGAMNSNYAFYLGLMDGGALPGSLTEDQILADVWGQEPEIRRSTTEWVYSFLMLAYQPLTDEDMAAYIAFSETEPGAQLNDALFDAFDDVFKDISQALGQAAAVRMAGQDI